MARTNRNQKPQAGVNGAVSELRPDNRRSFDLECRIGETLVHRSPSGVARSLRYLLAGLEMPQRLGVTSSIHGEGVTAMSRTLAALIANDWQANTCWVDLNWWKRPGRTHEDGLFDVTIADVLDSLGESADLPVKTSVPNLSMVAAGDIAVSSRFKVPKNEHLAKILTDLSNLFDYLIFDFPPVLVTSDAVSLGSLSNGYLLTVLQRATTRAQVGAALDAMTTAECLGTILNGARTRVPHWLLSSNETWALSDSG